MVQLYSSMLPSIMMRGCVMCVQRKLYSTHPACAVQNAVLLAVPLLKSGVKEGEL